VIQITATTAGNNLRNIRLVYSPDSTSSVVGTNESLLNSGEIFNPTFISRFSKFDTFRFQDWTWNFLQPLVGSWIARPTPSQAFWGIGKGLPSYNGGYSFGIGVPYEVQIALCNETKRNGWFNLPYNADDTLGESEITNCDKSSQAVLMIRAELMRHRSRRHCALADRRLMAHVVTCLPSGRHHAISGGAQHLLLRD